MKMITLPGLIAVSTLLLAITAQAHDPKEHMKSAEMPNCDMMENMHQSNMDMSDPVMQAMMQKCMGMMHQDDASEAGQEKQNPATEQDQGAQAGDEHDHQH